MKTANSEIQEDFRCVVSMQRYRFSSKVEHNHVIMNFPNFGFQANIVKSCSQWCSGLSDVVGVYKKNYGVSKRIFVKIINKVLLRWRNYENSKVLPSIRSQDGSSSRIRTLFWNYQEDYKNYKMK